MRSREYWALRAQQREHESYLRGETLNMKMFQEYQRAARDLRRQINDFYMRYAGENGLTYEQAVAALNKRERQEWRKSVGEYLEEINATKDPEVRARLLSDYKARYYNSQITRMEALTGQINQTMNDLYTRTVEQLKTAYGEEFTESYYRKMFDLQQRAGYRNEFAKVNDDLISNVISYPWKGANFSDRIWRSKEMLIYQLRETVTAGLIEGKGIAAMSRELSGKLGASYKNAERVIRTETNHFHNEAEKAAYKAAGVTEYEFMASLSERTCGECGALDGKHFSITEAKPGTNYPPIHPNCRCTTVEYDPDDTLDWLDSGVPMPDSMTYEEWASREKAGASSEEPEPQPFTEPKYLPAGKQERRRRPQYEKTLDAFKSVKYTGIEPEFAQEIDAQYLDLANQYPIDSPGLSVKTRKNSREFGHYQGQIVSLKGNTVGWKNEIVLSNSTMTDRSTSKILHEADAKFRAGRNMNASPVSTVDHEYAHAVDTAYALKKNPRLQADLMAWDGKTLTMKAEVQAIDALNRQLYYSPDRLSVRIKEAMRADYGLEEAEFFKMVRDELGSYAASSVAEFLAEGFSAYRHIPKGEQSEFLKRFGEYFDQFFDEVF